LEVTSQYEDKGWQIGPVQQEVLLAGAEMDPKFGRFNAASYLEEAIR
jgi:c-di-AMP phosphodiesterase-like protein